MLQWLYNGKAYTYFLPEGTGGHQFLLSTDYIIGEVTIKGKPFKGITLNYDIYNQQLLFDPAYRQEIKNYMQLNSIKIKKASDEIMTGLINYIGNLK